MRLQYFDMYDKVVPYIQYIVDKNGKRKGVEVLLHSKDKNIQSVGDLLRYLTVEERIKLKTNFVRYLTESYLKEIGMKKGFININVSRILLASDAFVDKIIKCANQNLNYKINIGLLENEHCTSDDSVFNNLTKLSRNGVGIYI